MCLLVGVLLLVVMFRTSDNLSHAYGLAVTGTMVVTTSLAFIVVHYLWKWRLWTSIAFIAGVFPLVVSTGAGSEMRRAMGITVFAGMIGVTFFGLFLTPVFYVVLEKLGARWN